MKIEGNNNIIECCSFHHCYDTGLQIGLQKNSVHNPGNMAASNLVLNCEQDSAASEHFQLHGPSVCATALRVDDADRVVSRAKALFYPD